MTFHYSLVQITREIKVEPKPLHMEIDLTKIDSPTLHRLISEVRNDEARDIGPYNRWHNRHNRSR